MVSMPHITVITYTVFGLGSLTYTSVKQLVCVQQSTPDIIQLLYVFN